MTRNRPGRKFPSKPEKIYMTDLRQYYFRLLFFSALLFAGAFVFARVSDERLVSDVFYIFVPFFAGVSFLTANLHQKGMERKARGYTHLFLGITMSRFFFFLMIMVAYSLIFRNDAVRFIVWFMVFYLFYTLFEVISHFRAHRKRE